ncbi:hypothetical protein HMSSN036_69420 [Paenibacillus macerans]|nr:hypothetical protein HMSSN036_69420 [Paenibacillus macerans]
MKKQFVVLGGGYGGTTVIHELFKGRRIPSDIQVVLVDRMPFQSLKTEYYALAAGTASDHELRVSFPEYPGLTIKYGEVASVELEQRRILFQDGDPLEYDQLVIALGCTGQFPRDSRSGGVFLHHPVVRRGSRNVFAAEQREAVQ